MTPAEYGAALAAEAPPLTVEQAEAAALLFVTVEQSVAA